MGERSCTPRAVTHPARTLSLPHRGRGLGTEVALFLRLCTLPGFPLVARAFGKPQQARNVLRTCFYDPRRIPETLYDEAERYGYPSFGEFVNALRSGVTIGGVKPAVRDYWVAQAPRYQGPVLVVWGRQDAVLPMASAADAREVMPQAQIQLIDRCGHLPMIEQPDEFLSALLPFLDRAEAAAAA